MGYINYKDKIIAFFMNNETNQTQFTIEEIMNLSDCYSERYAIVAIGKCVENDILKKITVNGVKNKYKGHLFSLNNM